MDEYNKELCDERHTVLSESVRELRTGQKWQLYTTIATLGGVVVDLLLRLVK